MDYSEYASTLGKAIGTSYIGIKQQRTFLCFVQPYNHDHDGPSIVV